LYIASIYNNHGRKIKHNDSYGGDASSANYFATYEWGSGNTFAEAYSDRITADIAYNSYSCSRVLFSKDGKEIKCDGMGLARNTIRSAFAKFKEAHKF
jgi:hypothetical protein